MHSEKNIKSAIVSHKNCIDGAASVLYARSICPEVEYYFVNHNEVNSVILDIARGIEPGGTFCITDICCDRETLELTLKILKDKKIRLRIYEHHVTMKWLKDFKAPEGMDFRAEFDMNSCASRIFYAAHKDDTQKLRLFREFSGLINDRDLWLNTDKRGALVARLHNMYGDELFVERILQDPTIRITEKEKILLAYQERKEDEHNSLLLETIQINTDANGFKYGFMYGNGAGSELLERALQEKELEYALLIDLNTKRGSIRSRGSFNCAEFAFKRGGGGHVCAAGFPVEFELPQV
jgi:oligoribonuclease NrnB/cAMP/cGMP phosphodiesterase (DHH superfamily)